MKAALNKEAEDKASKKEQRKKDWAKVKSSWSDLKRDWPQLGKKWRASKQQSPLLAHESPDTSKTYIHKRVHDTQLAVTPPAKSEVLIAKLNKSPKSK
jgi:hypothetical protein